MRKTAVAVIPYQIFSYFVIGTNIQVIPVSYDS